MYNIGRSAYQNQLAETIREYARICGCFTKEQAYLMFLDKHYETIDKLLNTMCQQRVLFRKDERYYTLNPAIKFDYDMMNCLWIMLDLKGSSLPNMNDFYFTRCTKPALIAFIKNDTLYEIVPINSSSAESIIFLNRQYEAETMGGSNGLHEYILVVQNTDIVDDLPPLNAPHMFAIVNDMPYSEMNYEAKKVCKTDYYKDEE